MARPPATSVSPLLARLLWSALIVVLGGVVILWLLSGQLPGFGPKSPKSAPLDDFGAVSDFTLTDQQGRTVHLTDFAGHPWVADFVFTRCSGPCPMMTARMARLADTLGTAPVRLVSFSVDPEHDTPEVLAEYAGRFGADPARWSFLTGPREAIFTLSHDAFHLAMGEPEADSTSALIQVAHSTRFILVDGAGRIRRYYDGMDDTALAAVRRDALALLHR